MIIRCEICGREFKAQRKSAKYCSNKCRLMAQRGIEFHGEIQTVEPSAALSDDEVLEIVQRAHIVASDLSRASMLTPSPLCLSLGRIAKKLEKSLRGEGL